MMLLSWWQYFSDKHDWVCYLSYVLADSTEVILKITNAIIDDEKIYTCNGKDLTISVVLGKHMFFSFKHDSILL